VVSFGPRVTSLEPVRVTAECCFGRAKFALALSDIEDATPLAVCVTVDIQPTKEDSHVRSSQPDEDRDHQPDAQRPDAGAAADRQRRDGGRASHAAAKHLRRRSIAP
jgi:hypothetical protein